MTSFSSVQQSLIASLLGATNTMSTMTLDNAADPLTALLDALPVYQDPTFTSAVRGAFATVIQSCLPNNGIASQPGDSGFGYSTVYEYTGPYAGYHDAFCNADPSGAAWTSLLTTVRQFPDTSSMALDQYATVLLTDACRSSAGASVDTQRVSNDLTTFGAAMGKGLAAGCVAFYAAIYQPTSTVIQGLGGNTDPVAGQLAAAIQNPAFIANVVQSLANTDPNSATATTWLLFNLWLLLRALDYADTDTLIGTVGPQMNIPPEIDASTTGYFHGGYVSWFPALTGADVTVGASATVTSGLPETSTTFFAQGGPAGSQQDLTSPHGYANSLCSWGSLANYQPPSTSCLGGATLVLMDDGSSRPVADIVVGDLVRSPRGTGRVVLVETPFRAGRELHRIDDLDAFVTPGHPLRVVGGGSASVEPWTTLDVVPTLGRLGVRELRSGTRLNASTAGRDHEYVVSRIEAQGPGGADELVYDLVVDDGSWSNAPYYVGGPETFVLVDSETVDPMHDPHGTLAVVQAMQVSLPACRRLDDPERALPHLLATVPLPTLPTIQVDDDAPRPGLPGAEYYLVDGQWDAVAATLEVQLVRRYGAALSRDALHGWRHGEQGPPGLFVHDVEMLVDEAPSAERVTMSLNGETAPVDFTGYRWTVGAPFADVSDTVVRGELWAGRAVVGVFHLDARQGVADVQRPFVLSVDGRVIGRLLVERVPHLAADRRDTWTRHDADSRAVATGAALGDAVVAALARPGG